MTPALLTALLILSQSQAPLATSPKTVIGPSNVFIADGANALIAGDGKDGVRLTLLGLEMARGTREKKTAHANLCAGYLMVEQPKLALEHCNWVLQRDEQHWRTYNNRALVYLGLGRYDESEADIRRGQALQPNSKKLKRVEGLYLDETRPVTPNAEVDDRRGPGDESVLEMDRDEFEVDSVFEMDRDDFEDDSTIN